MKLKIGKVEIVGVLKKYKPGNVKCGESGKVGKGKERKEEREKMVKVFSFSPFSDRAMSSARSSLVVISAPEKRGVIRHLYPMLSEPLFEGARTCVNRM